MNLEKVKQILGDDVVKDAGLYSLGGYIGWTVGDKEIVLDGEFTADELEAILWCMRHLKVT